MRRGEVYWVKFGPGVGGEIQKTRPAIVVSDNAAIVALNRLQVVPLTSQIVNVYPGETLVTLNGATSKALADQLTTVSKLRISNLEGKLSSTDMQRVDQSIRTQLHLS